MVVGVLKHQRYEWHTQGKERRLGGEARWCTGENNNGWWCAGGGTVASNVQVEGGLQAQHGEGASPHGELSVGKGPDGTASSLWGGFCTVWQTRHEEGAAWHGKLYTGKEPHSTANSTWEGGHMAQRTRHREGAARHSMLGMRRLDRTATSSQGEGHMAWQARQEEGAARDDKLHVGRGPHGMVCSA